MLSSTSHGEVSGGAGVRDRALSLRKAEALYGVPVHRLRQLRAQRALDFFRIGKALFVSERSLAEFLERHRQPAGEN